MPVIPTSPTLCSTVYTLIQRSIAVANELGENVAVIVLDQAIYCKAQEILWKNIELSSKVVLYAWESSTYVWLFSPSLASASVSASVLVESRVIGSSACKAVISGKHYNRGV